MPTDMNRRDALARLGGGLGSLGLASSLQAAGELPLGTHFPGKAKRVIHLFMNGGPFGTDFFDPKPSLKKYEGKRPKGADLRTERPTGGLMAVPYKYSQHGESGLPISELLPMTAKHADDLCILNSCYTNNPNHGPALLLMNNGTMTPKVPSMGAWMSYGLGSENRNLPSYMVLCPGKPVRFSILWNSAFLPAKHQGVYINHSKIEPDHMIPWLRNDKIAPDAQRRQLDLAKELNREHLALRGGADQALQGRIEAMETAYRMQFEATDAFDISREPESIRESYGKSPALMPDSPSSRSSGKTGRPSACPMDTGGTGSSLPPPAMLLVVKLLLAFSSSCKRSASSMTRSRSNPPLLLNSLSTRPSHSSLLLLITLCISLSAFSANPEVPFLETSFLNP